MVDALALRADERRDKLRKASGRSKYPEIRRFLNEETYLRRPQVSTAQSISCGRDMGKEMQTTSQLTAHAAQVRNPFHKAMLKFRFREIGRAHV